MASRTNSKESGYVMAASEEQEEGEEQPKVASIRETRLFTKLPVELRQEIWAYVLASPAAIEVLACPFTHPNLSQATPGFRRAVLKKHALEDLPPLFTVDFDVLYGELLHPYLSCNTFLIPSPTAAAWLTNWLSAASCPPSIPSSPGEGEDVQPHHQRQAQRLRQANPLSSVHRLHLRRIIASKPRRIFAGLVTRATSLSHLTLLFECKDISDFAHYFHTFLPDYGSASAPPDFSREALTSLADAIRGHARLRTIVIACTCNSCATSQVPGHQPNAIKRVRGLSLVGDWLRARLKEGDDGCGDSGRWDGRVKEAIWHAPQVLTTEQLMSGRYVDATSL